MNLFSSVLLKLYFFTSRGASGRSRAPSRTLNEMHWWSLTVQDSPVFDERDQLFDETSEITRMVFGYPI